MMDCLDDNACRHFCGRCGNRQQLGHRHGHKQAQSEVLSLQMPVSDRKAPTNAYNAPLLEHDDSNWLQCRILNIDDRNSQFAISSDDCPNTCPTLALSPIQPLHTTSPRKPETRTTQPFVSRQQSQVTGIPVSVPEPEHGLQMTALSAYPPTQPKYLWLPQHSPSGMVGLNSMSHPFHAPQYLTSESWALLRTR
jgi:hypothetical protein